MGVETKRKRTIERLLPSFPAAEKYAIPKLTASLTASAIIPSSK